MELLARPRSLAKCRSRERSSGNGFLVSVGRADAELDVGAFFMIGPGQNDIHRSAHSAFYQKLEVGGTTLVVAEAMFESVFKAIEAEMMRAAGIGSIQERTMIALV
jgi:hypothetical protein